MNNTYCSNRILSIYWFEIDDLCLLLDKYEEEEDSGIYDQEKMIVIMASNGPMAQFYLLAIIPLFGDTKLDVNWKSRERFL